MSTNRFFRSTSGLYAFLALMALAALLGACAPVTLTPAASAVTPAPGTVEAGATVPPPATATEVPPTVVAAPSATATTVAPVGQVTATATLSATAPVTVAPATPAQVATLQATAAISATAAPAATPNATPATPTSRANIAVQLADNSIQMVDASGTKTLLYQAPSPVDLSSIFPPGNVVSSTLYLPLSGTQARVVAVSPDAGPQRLDWIAQPVYGLAASPMWLAWGTGDLNAAPPASRILLSKPDGSGLTTAVEQRSTTGPRVLRVMRWSSDGKRLFFGHEPIGLGGYILFSGLTNLWAYDMASGESVELLHEPSPNAAVCIDDLAPNEQLAADHCQVTAMEVTDLATGQKTAIAAPPGVPSEIGAVGGARFSPDSTRLAYGLARRNPDNEQGWVGLADLTTGASTLVATSPANDYFSVVAWLDPHTLLLQSAGQAPGVWTLDVNGGVPQRISDGTFVGLLPTGGSPVGQACGEIQMQGLNKPGDPGARAALDCFWAAYQQCTPAALTVRVTGVDAGAVNQFAILPGRAQCQVQDQVVHYVMPQPTPAPRTVTCEGVIQQDGGLLFQSCGDQGDILVPGP